MMEENKQLMNDWMTRIGSLRLPQTSAYIHIETNTAITYAHKSMERAKVSV